MSSPVSGDPMIGGSAAVTLRISSAVLVTAVTFFFMAVIFVSFLYLYARYFLRHNRAGARFVFAADVSPGSGLDPAILRSLPVTVYRAADCKEQLECAVCLSELGEGEEARILPGCGHGFHLECIDMWFHSHSTCPLCRSPIGKTNPDEEAPAQDSLDVSPVFPTNVLVWGSQDQVNAGNVAAAASAISEERPWRSLVIEIPRTAVEGFPSPVSEPRSPLSARFRSLSRLWSQGRRSGGPCCSQREGDVEQGSMGCAEGSSLIAKSPKVKDSTNGREFLIQKVDAKEWI